MYNYYYTQRYGHSKDGNALSRCTHMQLFECSIHVISAYLLLVCFQKWRDIPKTIRSTVPHKETVQKGGQ